MWYSVAGHYERAIVANASALVMNTEPARAAMAELYPQISPRVLTVTNGFDDGDEIAARPRSRFVIAYAGTIYLDRNPEFLLRAAARVAKELSLTPDEFGIEFVGQVQNFDNVPLETLARNAGAGDYLRLRDSLPRRALFDLLAESSLLVSLPQDCDMAIPSKVYEYMTCHAWVLALAEHGTATELLLRGSRAKVVAPRDVDGISAVIRECVLQHRAGVVPTPAAEERFSRRSQAEKLLDALQRCLGSQPPVGRREHGGTLHPVQDPGAEPNTTRTPPTHVTSRT